MSGTQHIVMASGASAALLVTYGEKALVPAIGIIAGSILPDIDTPDSTLGQVFPSLSAFLNNLFGHRGLIHTIWLAVLFFVTGYYFHLSILSGIAMGIIFHLILDTCSRTGITPLYPARVKLSTFEGKTSGILGWLVTIAMQTALYACETTFYISATAVGLNPDALLLSLLRN